jgi:hypothetical protein
MRKRYRVLVLAAVVAALGVPVGFALSLESAVPVQSPSTLTSLTISPVLSDSAKLFAVGTFLIGISAFVRRRPEA